MRLIVCLSFITIFYACINSNVNDIRKDDLPGNDKKIECIVNDDLEAYIDSYMIITRVIESTINKTITYSLFFTKNDFNDTIFTISAGLNPIGLIDSNYEAKGWFNYQDKMMVISDSKNNLNLIGTNFYNSSCLKPIDTAFREMLIISPFVEPEIKPYRFWNLIIQNNKVIKVVKSK